MICYGNVQNDVKRFELFDVYGTLLIAFDFMLSLGNKIIIVK